MPKSALSPKKTRASLPRKAKPVVKVPVRDIPARTRLLLYVRAGGRCEFDGCNLYLLEHHLTRKEGNFGEVAHVVAFNEGGPRGRVRPHPQDIHDADNLMLLCHACHRLIDDNPAHYLVATLRQYKRQHEDRIYHVTGLGPDFRTTIVQFKANIGEQVVAIPAAQVIEAVAPRYPSDLRGYVIDLTTLHGNDPGFLQTATSCIQRELERIYAPGMDVERTRHISLFALAPIPCLAFLGSKLSNKVTVDFYQRHRDTGNWVWKTEGHPTAYRFGQIRRGTARSKVALLLSLSGTIHLESLPVEIDERYFVYEITLADQTPNPNYLRLKQDLTDFQTIYQTSLRVIGRDHYPLSAIHLFPAVPAPVAVACSYELLPKVDPALYVYDNDKAKGGFTLALRINER